MHKQQLFYTILLYVHGKFDELVSQFCLLENFLGDVLASLDDYDAVVTAQHITDSLGSYLFKEVDRSQYYLMQSPEAFRFPLLSSVFNENSNLTEVTQQLPDGSSIYLNFEFVNNYKLTYPEDLVFLKTMIDNRNSVHN